MYIFLSFLKTLGLKFYQFCNCIVINRIAHNRNGHAAAGKRKEETRSCEKCRHLERGTHVPDGGIPQREDVEMVRTSAKAR